jgi:hypothetical protein
VTGGPNAVPRIDTKAPGETSGCHDALFKTARIAGGASVSISLKTTVAVEAGVWSIVVKVTDACPLYCRPELVLARFGLTATITFKGVVPLDGDTVRSSGYTPSNLNFTGAEATALPPLTVKPV